MGHSEFDPAAREWRPWNAGRMVSAKRALKPQQVWAIRFWLDREGRLRDRPLFDLAIDSKLRGCDVVKIRIADGRAVCQEEFLSTLARPLDARVEGEFDPDPARLAHDEMGLRPLARELRGEFQNNVKPAGNAFVQGIQSRSIGNCEGNMMKADIGAPVERDCSVRRLDLP
jgi:hypothetical protein